jgi:M6 family metalloprotease-like protein
VKKLIQYFSNFVLALLFVTQVVASNFNNGSTTWSQPNNAIFTANTWGDEYRVWMETQEGYRFVPGSDGWYYYACLDSRGEFFPTQYRVGVDQPPTSSYKLERSSEREAEINRFIADKDSCAKIQSEIYKQLQIARNSEGRPLVVRINIILVEFNNRIHYTGGNRLSGYLVTDFEKEFFSENQWYDPEGVLNIHPEGDKIFGSMRDYYHQMSLGKFRVEGRVVNPVNANGTPQWISLPQDDNFYDQDNNLESYKKLFDTSFAKASSYGWISSTDTPNDTLKYFILYAGNVRPVTQWVSAYPRWGFVYLSERKGPSISTTDPSFLHFGWPAHEFGHLIGFSDEYTSFYERFNLFDYCLMADAEHSGPNRKGECPGSLSPFYRIKMDWVKSILIDRDTTNFQIEYNYFDPKFFRINPFIRDTSLNEHYIIESRGRQGFDLYLPNDPTEIVYQPGRLLVWYHNMVDNVGSGPFIKDKVCLKFADNVQGKDTYRTDFFPMDFITNRQSLNDLTIPSASLGWSMPEYEIPGTERSCHFALNGIQKLPNGNTRIDTIALKLTMAAGAITQNTTWQYDVRVVDNVTVTSGATITILPGTRVMFEPGKSLIFNNGKLVAKGNTNNRITFTSASQTPSPDNWLGIVFSGGGPDTLTYCDISYAEKGIQFVNTQPNSYMNNVSVSQSLYDGVSVSAISPSNTALQVYNCNFSNNRERGLLVNNARVSISKSYIENNGAGNISPGVYVSNGAKVYFDSSYIQSNVGSGIEVGGYGSRIVLSPDEIQRGYNTLYQHGVSELYVRDSSTALLGYTAAIRYCNCIDPIDQRVGTSMPTGVMSLSPQCPPGCIERYRYEPRAGWNNVYNSFLYGCRLINNATATQVQARYNYWGTEPSNQFCGPVDASYPLTGAVSKQFMVLDDKVNGETITENNNITDIIDWLKQLKSDVEENKINAIDALHQLALYVGNSGAYSNVLEVPWDFFLVAIERNSQSQQVKRLATVMRVQAKLDRGEYRNAIDLADQVLRRNIDDNLWLYCQSRKIFSHVGLGDIATARTIFNAMRYRGERIDSKAVNVLNDYLNIASISVSGGSNPSDKFVESPTKVINKPESYSISQNYPNPFNPVTQIKFSIPEASYVTLKIFDVLGREVLGLINGWKEEGTYDIVWDASRFSSGVYFYKLQAGNFISVNKMLLTK